jgi:hypothetical protein
MHRLLAMTMSADSVVAALLTAAVAAVGALLLGPAALLGPDDALAAGIGPADGHG